jgi:hypothetical protein
MAGPAAWEMAIAEHQTEICVRKVNKSCWQPVRWTSPGYPFAWIKIGERIRLVNESEVNVLRGDTEVERIF